ncbi:methyltransferase domain-containing protein [Cohnella sp. GCM10027633]|uniref:class I SAM-dependent methyltransferase n=1 Tax=unclassified Cohnella TaxID=2636738 RepID=UPI00362E1617
MAYDNKLNEDQWGEIFNIEKYAKTLINSIEQKKYYTQTKEMLKIATPGSKTLEIGSGSGQTSLCLAQLGCEVTLLDYSKETLALAEYAADKLGLKIKTVCMDATKDLPFGEKEFDFVFHSGLLEHFEPSERVDMLTNWKRYGKKHVSMIPNAASLCYRIGKERQEHDGTWQWGRELPDYTQIREFMLSGFEIEKEYTAGEIQSLDFLERDHPLKALLRDFWEQRQQQGITENFNQGYLLITVGNNPN